MLTVTSVTLKEHRKCCSIYSDRMKHPVKGQETVYTVRGMASGHFPNTLTFDGKNYKIFTHAPNDTLMSVDIDYVDSPKETVPDVVRVCRIKDGKGGFFPGQIGLWIKGKDGKNILVKKKGVQKWMGSDIDASPDGQWPVTLLAVQVFT